MEGMDGGIMAKQYSRTEIKEMFTEIINRGNPIIIPGVGNGISAKFAEKGGADMIGLFLRRGRGGKNRARIFYSGEKSGYGAKYFCKLSRKTQAPAGNEILVVFSCVW